MLYCDPINDVGTRLAAGHGFTSDQLTQYVARASSRVQASIGEYFPFPEYFANPATPETIREATWQYALYLALLDMGIDNYQDEEGSTERLRARALATCRELRNDEAHIEPIEVANETLSFGGGILQRDGETISGYADTHALAWRDVYVFADSLRIAGFRNGVDFRVEWSADFDAWLLWRLDTAIGTNGETLRYRFSWKKRRQIDAAPAGRGVRLVRS